MASFNKAQITAMNHGKGPMMVLAGPGSGKTLVITQRTKLLIEKQGVAPSNILVITFTKAAAKEMQERFLKLVGQQNLPVTFGTFHSVFFTMLRHAYHYTGANVLGEELKKQYIKEIIDKLELEFDDEADFILSIIGEISLVKSEMMSLEHYYSSNCADDIFKKIYKSYEDRLARANQIDFDDMLVFTYELLKERKDILSMWQRRYPYILIDEFQDINKIQYEIVKMLALPSNNLFIVGDDDQSIYRFRGANPEIMLGFPNDYKEAKTVLLDTNYRSSLNIVEGSKRVIKNNSKRFHKDIKSHKGKEVPIDICEVKNQGEENRTIIEKIKEYNRKGILLSDMAILFRTNTQPRLLLERMMEFNIPFKMRDGIPNLYEHWIAKNMITYIKIALGDRDRASFLSIINRPKRYLSREYFKSPKVSFSELKNEVSDKAWMVDRVNRFEMELKMIVKMTPFAAINYIRKGIGYENYLEEYASYRRMKVADLLDVLDEIQESSKEYNSFADWFLHIEDYSKHLLEQIKNKDKKEIDSVTMATMHSSKGLEYEVVFILDADEEITPHKKSIKDADIEEERRMFYVAMTRAKTYLHIFTVEEVYNKKLDKSRFVGELIFDKDDLKVGIRVIHKKYGVGSITYLNDKKIAIYFERMKDTRTLDLVFATTNGLLQIEEQNN